MTRFTRVLTSIPPHQVGVERLQQVADRVSLLESGVEPKIVGSSGRITGMRSWISARSVFGVVVMMEQVSMVLPSGLRHESQIPANAKMESSAMVKQNGVFVLPFFAHS